MIYNISIEDLPKKGIYQIKNIINKMVYIGSTTHSFQRRFREHERELRNNKHNNIYLQNSYNKYGDDNFEFSILEFEIVNDLIREKEQYYINNTKNIFNINKDVFGFSNEVLKKAVRRGVNHHYYGKKMENTDHLKVKKTITLSLQEAWKKTSDRGRKKAKPVYVYDLSYNFVGYWKSAVELEEESLTDNFKLKPYMVLRNKNGRNGKNPYYLKASNIQMVYDKKTKNYKGLIFSNERLHEEIHEENWVNSGEV